MSDSTTLTFRIDSATKARLEKLAERTRRSKSFLANEAVENFLEVQEWQIAGIEKAIEAFDRGESISHEEMLAWLDSLDAAGE